MNSIQCSTASGANSDADFNVRVQAVVGEIGLVTNAEVLSHTQKFRVQRCHRIVHIGFPAENAQRHRSVWPC